ncbi:MAG: hypothetical protein ACRD2Z_03205 [Thermoanaerobaculia bacterium]
MSTTTKPQHLVALERANEIRLAGARWRREVREYPKAEGQAMLAEALERNDIPDCLARMDLGWFLTAPQRLGPARAARLALGAGVRRSKCRVRDLTLRQRSVLAARLRGERAEEEA